MQDFAILETCFYTNKIYLLEYHWQRMVNSLKYFNFALPPKHIFTQEYRPNSCVRISVFKQDYIVQNIDLSQIALYTKNQHIQLGLAKNNIDLSLKEFYLHKTTFRQHYNYVNPNVSDIILHNNGYITECTKANIAILKNNIWYTPSNNILLKGTLRQYLLYYKFIQPKALTIQDLIYAEKILWFNSLRRVYIADLVLD